MDRKNLKLRNLSWYARLKVPPSLQSVIGKSELVRALRTRDLKEANRLKHAVLAAELTRAETQATLPRASAAYVLSVAKELRESISKGETKSATQILSSTLLDDYLESQAKKHGRDPQRAAIRCYPRHTSGHSSSHTRCSKTRLGFADPALVFHTLRNAFMQRCEEGEVPESTTKLIAGHSRQSDITYGLYSPGVKFEALRKAVAKVTYGKADALVRKLAKSVEITKRSARRPRAAYNKAQRIASKKAA